MNHQWAAGRNIEERPARSRWLEFHLTPLIVAATAVLLLVWAVGWAAGAVLVTSAAVMLANYARAGSKEPSVTADRAAGIPDDDMGSIGYRHLNLAEESPTPRSIVQVIPAGTMTVIPSQHKRPGRPQAIRVVCLAATTSALISWVALPLNPTAARTVTTLLTVLAAFSFIAALRTGGNRSWRKTFANPRCNEEPRYFYPTTHAKVELHACFESARSKRGNE